ncbi:uncharacterized protein Dvar_71260 [Desulfosarcina variabilis str. Montpellier]|uniref:hypothetical protein n=1 Tax=Desulfosarcina variabilis TaxID=2300 RepID=UPI003AFA2CC6
MKHLWLLYWIVLTTFSLLVIPSVALSKSPNYIIFASMENFNDIKNKEWALNFEDLMEESYWMKYTSFKRVAAKINNKSIKPKSAVECSLNNIALLPSNSKAVKYFHDSVRRSADKYLQLITKCNRAKLLIFDQIKKHHIERFINGKTDELNFVIRVYNLDSNTLGMQYIQIDKKSFVHFNKLKQKIHLAISEAFDEALQENFEPSNYEEDIKDENSGNNISVDDSGRKENEPNSFWD